MSNTQSPEVFSSKEAHQEILSNSPKCPEHTFFIDTDGSGYCDAAAGACAVVVSPKIKFADFRVIGYSSNSVERAEFEALLLGLQAAYEGLLAKSGIAEKVWQELTKSIPHLVWWQSDRESLVLSVAINPATKESYYKRRTCLDLWARFDFYGQFFKITPVFRNRDTAGAAHYVTDYYSSEMRVVLKEYLENVLPNVSGKLAETLNAAAEENKVEKFAATFKRQMESSKNIQAQNALQGKLGLEFGNLLGEKIWQIIQPDNADD